MYVCLSVTHLHCGNVHILLHDVHETALCIQHLYCTMTELGTIGIKPGIFCIQTKLICRGIALLCELAILVKGKSFVIPYTYFSFKHLMENPLVKEFSLLLKGKCFIDKRPKGFSFSYYIILL